MTDPMDVERILNERITQRTNIPPQHSHLLHTLKKEIADEMKAILRENRDLQDVRDWLQKKTKELNRLLETKRINPATPAYTTIRQIEDAAAHFAAEYRAQIKLARREKRNAPKQRN